MEDPPNFDGICQEIMENFHGYVVSLLEGKQLYYGILNPLRAIP